MGATPRFWQLNQFQPVGWYQRGDARGPVEAGASPFEPPKSDADKRVMERYVELDIKYKYDPDEVTELMREPDPELITPPLADLELYNFKANQEEGNMIWLTVTRWS